MLSKRQDNKTRQCTVRFLDNKVQEVDYAGEDESKKVLERITTKVNAITAMGLFKMKREKFRGTGTPYADAKQMGISDGCNRPISLTGNFITRRRRVVGVHLNTTESSLSRNYAV